MQPKDFILSKKEFKRYLNAVMRMPGTPLHKQLAVTRATSAVLFAGIVALAFLVQLPGALQSPARLQSLGMTTLIEILLLAVIAWRMPPLSLRRRQMRMERFNGLKGERFREVSRVRVEDGFYLRQTGSATVNRLPLAELQWARLGDGCGVVVQFGAGMCDYLPASAFSADCPAPAWCAWLMEQAEAARQEELGEPTPPAVTDGEPQVCFTLEADQMVQLWDEMTGLVQRTGRYWRYLAPQLVTLGLAVVILIPLAFLEPLVAGVLLLAVALVVVLRLPPVRRAMLRRQINRPELAMFQGPQSLTLTPQGVLVRRESGDNLIEYAMFGRVLEGKKGTYLLLRSGVQAHLIPNDAFPDEAARQAFVARVEERIKTV